jgi:hypothetical protein
VLLDKRPDVLGEGGAEPGLQFDMSRRRAPRGDWIDEVVPEVAGERVRLKVPCEGPLSLYPGVLWPPEYVIGNSYRILHP